MRPSPKASPAEIKRKEGWSFEARVVLITRLFGGGARTREIDQITWLRSSAAKSAMRAWWRSRHAHEFASLSALRAREEGLFGAPGSFDAAGRLHGGPGLVEVVTRARLDTPPTDYREPPSNPLGYALFPAQEMGQAAAKVALPSDKSWATIELTSASNEPDIHEILLESMRLWLTLGGAGSRTRRGAGAMAAATRDEAMRLGLPCTPDELEAFLVKHCQRQAVPEALAAVFCLARTRRVYVGSPEPTGEKAQKKALAVLRSARQDRSGPMGRSRWPEPDAIRLKWDRAKAWKHGPNRANAEQYPRAALGLPIVMHFKDPAPTEPPEHHVLAVEPDGREWRKLERYSSPILIRPVRVWQGNREQYVPVAVFTDCTLLDNVRPLVTTEPKKDPARKDVVDTFSIAAVADVTLRRIESWFDKDPDFRAL